MHLDLLYSDEHLAAIHKPSGLLVHPSLIDKREKLSAMKLLRDQLGRWYTRCTGWTNPPQASCCSP